MSTALGKAAVLGILALKLVASKNSESPNEPIAEPESDGSVPVSIRYSSSRLYIIMSAVNNTRGGCVTLARKREHQGGKEPLYAVDPESGNISDSSTGTWLLTDELFVQDGITLQAHGFSGGGDADELCILSTNDTFINLRAHGGSLDFLSAKI